MLTSSAGGQLFDEDFNPLMEDGSVARETLKWWRDTIQEWEIADPASLELRWIPAIRAHATGDHIFSNTRERYMNFANDPQQSETAGQHEIFAVGTPTYDGNLWSLMSNSYDRDLSWQLLQYFGGETQNDGYFMAVERAKFAYTSGWPRKALENEEIQELWGSLYDLDNYNQQFEDAAFIGTACAAKGAPWYNQWVDQYLVPNLQDCLGGAISADEAAGNIAQGAEDLNA